MTKWAYLLSSSLTDWVDESTLRLPSHKWLQLFDLTQHLLLCFRFRVWYSQLGLPGQRDGHQHPRPADPQPAGKERSHLEQSCEWLEISRSVN